MAAKGKIKSTPHLAAKAKAKGTGAAKKGKSFVTSPKGGLGKKAK